MHPRGASAVFSGDRGALGRGDGARRSRAGSRASRDIGGIISAGGSGGTTLATAGMRALPVGIPKIMVSTVAAGDVARYVGAGRHHDVPFGRRRSGPQLDHRAGARQRRPCAGRHDRAAAERGEACEARAQAGPAGARHHHVRRDHALRAGGDQAARAGLRLPGLPRHRHRRAVDGERSAIPACSRASST